MHNKQFCSRRKVVDQNQKISFFLYREPVVQQIMKWENNFVASIALEDSCREQDIRGAI